ncbi:MAG: hypothetical protein U5K29_12865 [Acidimicrobiales bacterium]|nr:hypothetical protein [Acidimicrobiales bacterium]
MESPATDGPATDEDVAALATRLAELDEELSDTERRLLRAVLVSAMDPLDRRRHLGSGFDDDQRSVLDRLEAERGGPPSEPARPEDRR